MPCHRSLPFRASGSRAVGVHSRSRRCNRSAVGGSLLCFLEHEHRCWRDLKRNGTADVLFLWYDGTRSHVPSCQKVRHMQPSLGPQLPPRGRKKHIGNRWTGLTSRRGGLRLDRIAPTMAHSQMAMTPKEKAMSKTSHFSGGVQRLLWSFGSARAHAFATLSIVAFVGCASNGSYVWVNEVPDAVLMASPSTQVATGDVVSVRVFGQDPLSVRLTVRADGMLSIPLIGQVHVIGRLPADISQEIAHRLEPFVNNPYVMTVIDESRIKVVVAGEVRKPGVLVLDGPVDLLTAISNAGGMTEFAGESDIYVLRPTSTGMYRIRFRWHEISRGIGNAGRFRLRDNDQVVIE
jgi:polysaccharide biosynthesis/export protein